MAKEIYHDNISLVATQRTKCRRRAMSRQKIACRDRTWEECNKSAETKKVDVATRYLMSRQEIKEQYRKNTVTDQFMLRHNEK